MAGLSPGELVDKIIAEVKVFVGTESQRDDMICTVLGVETQRSSG